MKRQLTTLIAVMGICSFAFGQTFQRGGINYNITSDSEPRTVEVANNRNYTGDANIPDSVTYEGNTYAVTSVEEQAFYFCRNLTSVIIPNTVTTIKESAFAACSNLTSVIISNSITTIERGTFYACKGLTSITIPNSVTSIGYSAFSYCSGLISVTLGNSITIIGNSAFSKCSGLTNLTIPNSVTIIDVAAFSDCSGLTSVTIPNSVTSIGFAAFSGCSSLTSVTIPNSVTSIGSAAFSGCSSLKNIIISHSVTTIELSTFSDCSSLKSITIPNSVTSIEGSVFFNCDSLTNIAIPNSVTSIGHSAFAHCRSLTNITIPNSVTFIGGQAFFYCSNLTSITIPNSVTSIEASTFLNCINLISVTIPNSVTSIGDQAFLYCNSLTSITIPNSVTYIDGMAFAHCSNLTEIYVKAATPPTLEQSAFYNISDRIMVSVYVPCQSVAAYQSAAGWSTFNNITASAISSVSAEVNNPQMGSVNVVSGDCKTATAIIKATANENYHFVQWHDGNTDNPRTISIMQDSTFTAEFAQNIIYYQITVLSNNDSIGTVTGGGIYEENTEAILAAVPAHGYRFMQWQDGNTDNPRTISIMQDSTFTAEFALINSISVATTFPFEIYSRNNTLIIKQAEGQSVAIFDMMGRCVFQTIANEESSCTLPTAGVYIVKIGERFVRKAVIN